jgi:type I restriction enzyme S subunit
MTINNNTPDIRFSGFSGDWVEEKLGDIANFSKGSGYSKADLRSSGHPIILYGRLYTKYQTVISEVDTFVNESKNSVKSQGNEVVVPASGETAEDIARASAVKQKGIILGGDLNVVGLSDAYNSVFTALKISNGQSKSELSKKAQGKSVVHIRNSDLQSLLLDFPNLEEQTTIGNFFQHIDETITL